jgi:diguanylate cyclase (GGDEF)-like protein
MEELLTHLVQITGHRDHNMLDASMLSALHELVGAAEVRALEVFRFREELYVRQRVLLKSGKVTATQDNAETDHGDEPLTNYPILLDCIEERKNSAEEITPAGIHILWFPIWINDKIDGCVALSSPTPFTSGALDVIKGIISVYRNYQNLLDYSERDSLTSLLNRKTFDENFSRMVSSTPQLDEQTPSDPNDRRSNAGAKEQWLAVVDIDHFKRVNDQFGHLYGDEVLILVANLLRSSFRAQDRVFRFGGEEFVILLRSTTLEDAKKTFERFRSNIEQHVFPQVGQVTVSLGFASISNATPVVILGHADQALYYAKSNGRNRVCYYDELVSSGLLKSEVSNESVEFFFDDFSAPETN